MLSVDWSNYAPCWLYQGIFIQLQSTTKKRVYITCVLETQYKYTGAAFNRRRE